MWDRFMEQGWVAFAAVLGVSLVAALVLHRVVCRVLMRAGNRDGLFAHVIQRTRLGLSILLPLLAVQLAVRALPLAPRAIELTRHALIVLWLAAFVYIAIRIVSAIEDVVLSRHQISAADNLSARRVHTQARVLARSVQILLAIVGIAAILMTFPGVRQIGASMLASAGLAGIVVGFAARPVLENLIGGLQLALTQPIRIDDVVVVEEEMARVEDIGAAFVVLRIWDDRRLIVPLTWFIQNPFENWTHTTSQNTGTVKLWVDFDVPIKALRAETERYVDASPHYDGRSRSLQVVDQNERGVQVRASFTTGDSGASWNLAVGLREHLVEWLRERRADPWPRQRTVLSRLDVERLSEGANDADRSATSPAHDADRPPMGANDSGG